MLQNQVAEEDYLPTIQYLNGFSLKNSLGAFFYAASDSFPAETIQN